MLARRPCRPEDDEFLRAVYASTRAAEISLFGWSPAQTEIFLRMQFDAQDRYYRSVYPAACFDIVECDGVPIGRLYFAQLPQFLQVIDIALLPAWQGQGIGSKLLRDLQQCAGRQCCAMRLHVEADNPAQRLYQRLGFRVIGNAAPYTLLEWLP